MPADDDEISIIIEDFPPHFIKTLEQLVATGQYGATISEVAEKLLMEGMLPKLKRDTHTASLNAVREVQNLPEVIIKIDVHTLSEGIDFLLKLNTFLADIDAFRKKLA